MQEFLRRSIYEEYWLQTSVPQYFNGELTMAEAIDKTKQYTRNFAKRQVTWYNKMPYIKWFDLEDYSNYDQIVEEMHQILVKKYKLL